MKMYQRRKPMAEINVVPYIDVMLVLLVIFMITAPLLSQGVKVDLPNAAAKPLAQQEKRTIILSIDAKGRYYLNSAQNPEGAMDANEVIRQVSLELQTAKKLNHQGVVLVKGDRNVDYGKVVQGMTLLQKAGADSVGLMTQQFP